ncbi:hypothetical protein [Anaerobium acetethylicum]|uniref:Replication restart DNA helicase PriA n=1 Tax=Anaerobium acetethylicum TaxID=1619234 RepID=A0A1D3TY57_9FIRM|nr:hypothetical protein [Anaerobium acetethylicum]SCP99322.1 hypothetical protein SAMN05421730_10385 [Anaerobium acetethylicum]
MGEIYYCKNCGGVMEFDVETQALKCPNCDTVVEIENNEETIREHTLTLHAVQTIKAEEKTSTTMSCKGCGAVIEVDSHSTASSCPYCGSSFVLAEKQIETLLPDGVLPFKIDKNRVGDIFRDWLKGRWLAPNELKHLYQQDRLQGIYVPYWTFDANLDCPYTAMGGRDHTESYRGSDGKQHTRVVTNWYPTSGRIRHFFDDVLVMASNKMKQLLLKGVEPFNTKELSSYSPDYFSGYNSEVYSVDLQDAYKAARSDIENRLEDMAAREVRMHYDHVRDIRIRPNYSDETYKHILLPVYSTSYFYKDKNYTVLINGQNGRIKGDYPKSWVKITLLVIAAIIAALLLYFIFNGGSMDVSAAGKEYYADFGTECYAEYDADLGTECYADFVMECYVEYNAGSVSFATTRDVVLNS